MTNIDGKLNANSIYHAGVESIQTIGYTHLTNKDIKMQTHKVDFNMGDIAMLTVECFACNDNAGYVKQARNYSG